MNDRLRAHLALIAANLIYGVNYGIAKQVMPDYLSPFAFVFARISGACLLFWMLSVFLVKQKLAREDIPRLLLATVFGVAVNQSLFLNGLNLTTPIDAAIIMTATPILVLVVARILVREPITIIKVMGIVTGAAGAILLILYNGNISFGNRQLTGNSIIFANATSYAVYLVIVKPLMEKYHPVILMRWVFLFGLLLVSGPGLPAFIRVDWGTMPGDIMLSVLFVVVGTTFLAYLFNMFSLKYVKPITVSIYIYSQPVIASVVAMILGQDVVTLVKVVAAVLVFTGVYFVSYSSSSQNLHYFRKFISSEKDNT
jgi:drug/metabolite transporter (DMT)-like permease